MKLKSVKFRTCSKCGHVVNYVPEHEEWERTNLPEDDNNRRLCRTFTGKHRLKMLDTEWFAD